eukprot:6029355-Karenia_brevis.AAC.1
MGVKCLLHLRVGSQLPGSFCSFSAPSGTRRDDEGSYPWASTWSRFEHPRARGDCGHLSATAM